MADEKNTSPAGDKNITDKLEYPAKDDIYNQDDRVPIDEDGNIINPEEAEIEQAEEQMIGSELDVPGSELDDENEIIGSEDEENNYYSLGGDNHENLEEDNS